MSDIQNKNLDTLIKKTTIDYSKVFSMIPSEMIHEKNIAMVCLRTLKYASKLIDSAKSIVVFDDRDAVELWCSGIATYGLKPRFIEWDYTESSVGNLISRIKDFMTNHETNEVACVSITRNLYNYSMEDAIVGDAMNKEITKSLNMLSDVMRIIDYVPGNPPYDGDLHLQIHKSLRDRLSDNGEIVFVHPVRVVIDHRIYGDYQDKDDVDFRNGLTHVDIFGANKLFGIDNQTPLMVSHWKKSVPSNNLVSVHDDFYSHSSYTSKASNISKYGEITGAIKKLFTLVKDSENLTKHCSIKNKGVGFSCGFSGILGNLTDNKVSSDFYSIVRPNVESRYEKLLERKNEQMKEYDEYVKSHPDEEVKKPKISLDSYSLWFSFNTEEERENFLGFLETKPVKFLLSLSKDDKHLNPKDLCYIPWMDFTKKWTDESLIQEWDIDDDTWKLIDSHIETVNK